MGEGYENYFLKRARIALAPYKPLPDEPGGTFMGVPLPYLDKQELIAVIVYMREQEAARRAAGVSVPVDSPPLN